MTATSQGATNRRKGHETERMVVRWLRQVGWPDACTTRAKLGHDYKIEQALTFNLFCLVTAPLALEVETQRSSLP